MGVAARACYEEWADAVLLSYHQQQYLPNLLEAVLKDPRRPIDNIYVAVLCSTQHTLELFQQVIKYVYLWHVYSTIFTVGPYYNS